MFFVERKSPQDYLEDYAPNKTYLSGVLTGLATGLAAGLAVGFLFAPRSGKELRRQIAGVADDQTKEARNQWDKTKAQARETIGTIKTNVGLAADKAEDELHTYVDKAVKYASDAEKEADKAVEEADKLASETRSNINKFRNASDNR
jgi:gas vesicle protein